MVPSFHRNGSKVGNPLGFGVELVKEAPATRPSRWRLHPPAVAKASGPPSVPRSCTTPFFQIKVCVWEANGVRPMDANGSGLVSTVPKPTTCPLFLTYSPALSTPGSKVPMSMISPSFHRTACSVWPPVSGSMSAVKEPPVAQSRALTEVAWLKFTPGSAPRSVRTLFCHRKAWTRKQSAQPGAVGGDGGGPVREARHGTTDE